MAIPKYNVLQYPILLCLQDGREHLLEDVRTFVAKHLNLTDEDLNITLPNSSYTVYKEHFKWAKGSLCGAGLVEIPRRAVVKITHLGQAVLKDAPTTINATYLDGLRKRTATSSEQPPMSLEFDTTETPESIIERHYDSLHRSLADELLNEVCRLSPVAFERMILDLMSKMGYGTFKNAAKTTARTGDEGIDGIIMQDKLGFDLIYVQAKLWERSRVVGRPEIQSFVGAIIGQNNKGKGLFVTTAGFSQPAREYATQQHIILIDGQRLAELMIAHDFGVTTKRTFALKALDSTLFEDYQA